MVPTYHPLEAYCRDIARLASRDSFGPDDADWIAASLALQRYVDATPTERQRLATDLATVLAVGDEITVCDAALRVAFDVEKMGAWHLAMSWLDLLERLLPSERYVEVGRVFAYRARLVRKFGDMVSSRAISEEIERMGQLHAEPELTARAWLGYGVMAHSRGNIPEARRWYSAAALVADDNGFNEPSYVAHVGLQTCALIGRHFDLAMLEGWRAFALAEGDMEREAEVLTNLAQTLHECGEHRVALRGFAAAVSKSKYLDTLLPALGGVASSAAHLGQPDVVDAAADRLERLLAVASPLPHALVLLEMSDANLVLDRADEAARFRERAALLADAHGFHEVVYRVANPAFIANARFVLGPESHRIAHDIGRISAPVDLCATR